LGRVREIWGNPTRELVGNGRGDVRGMSVAAVREREMEYAKEETAPSTAARAMRRRTVLWRERSIMWDGGRE